jgi:hypothetical protein
MATRFQAFGSGLLATALGVLPTPRDPAPVLVYVLGLDLPHEFPGFAGSGTRFRADASIAAATLYKIDSDARVHAQPHLLSRLSLPFGFGLSVFCAIPLTCRSRAEDPPTACLA